MSGRTGDLVQRHIYYFGCWEPNATAFVERRLAAQPSRTFIDVGANIGYFSLLAAKCLTGGQVVSIEALPATFAKLQANVALNGYRNIRTVLCAATDTRRDVAIFPADPGNEGATTMVPGTFQSSPVTVQGRPLPEILSAEEIATARVIKIDVEGAESEVIAGLEPVLPQLSADCEVVMEINVTLLGREKSLAIVETFRRHGFSCFSIENDYRPEYYWSFREPKRPQRADLPTQGLVDVIFSRETTSEL